MRERRPLFTPTPRPFLLRTPMREVVKRPWEGVSHSLAVTLTPPGAQMVLVRSESDLSQEGRSFVKMSPYKATKTRAGDALPPPRPAARMLCTLLSFCLMGLALGGHYGAPQTSCQPRHETLTVTSTSLLLRPQQVTQLDLQYEQQTVSVTSVVLVPSTVLVTQTITHFPSLEVVTHTSLLTATQYQTTFLTHLATAVATQVSQLVATAQAVEEQVITQTAVVDHSVTSTLTVTDLETTYKTLTVTDTFSTFLTYTQTETFEVTETSFQTVIQYATNTVTSFTEHTVDATVTVTEHDFVTKCPEPKVTYNH